jgi:flagellar biosynthesis protein FlhF
MHIKRFVADSLDEALEAVRVALGPDALILSSRTITLSRGAFGLLARRGVEVQAALERGSSAERSAAADLRRPDESGRREGGHELESELRSLLGGLRQEIAVLRRRESFEDEVRSELRGLRVALAQHTAREIVRAEASGSHAGVDLELARLVAAGIDLVHARALAAQRERESDAGGKAPRSLDQILSERLEGRLTPPRADGARRIRMLVGAPGSGKTTTLAKLAGRSEEGEREVALVSLDPFRMGARDQLRAFAELLDSPFSAISSPAELAEVARRETRRSILVDTAGRSPADALRLVGLESLDPALREATSIELVVDATARAEVARAQVERFASLRPDRLILTKLDECDSLAPVVNLLLDERCPPVCWLGTGQRVPEDLEIAEPAVFVASLARRAA